MLGLSFAEIIVILLVAIIIIPPRDIPAIIRKINQLFIKSKSLLNNAKVEIDELKKHAGISDIQQDIDAINQEAKEIIGDDGKKYQSYDLSDIAPDLLENREDADSKEEKND